MKEELICISRNRYLLLFFQALMGVIFIVIVTVFFIDPNIASRLTAPFWKEIAFKKYYVDKSLIPDYLKNKLENHEKHSEVTGWCYDLAK